MSRIFQSRMSRMKRRPTITRTLLKPRCLWRTRLGRGGRTSLSINRDCDLPVGLPITIRDIVVAAAVDSHIPRCTVGLERTSDRGSASRSLISTLAFRRRFCTFVNGVLRGHGARRERARHHQSLGTFVGSLCQTPHSLAVSRTPTTQPQILVWWSTRNEE